MTKDYSEIKLPIRKCFGGAVLSPALTGTVGTGSLVSPLAWGPALVYGAYEAGKKYHPISNFIDYGVPIIKHNVDRALIDLGIKRDPTKPRVTVTRVNGEAPQTQTQAQTQTQPSDSTTTSRVPNPRNDDNNKDKKNLKDEFKENAKKVGLNIARGYGRALKGTAYGTGFVGVPGAIGYGIYKASQPGPSEMEKSIQNQELQLKQLIDYKRNQQRLDSLERELRSISNSTSVGPVNQDSARSSQILGVTQDGRIIVGNDTITPITYNTNNFLDD